MARIIVSDCEKKEKSPKKQDIVKATYSVNVEEGLFQIETYGSSSRQNPDSASQTIQMDKESAQQLIALLEKELFLQKSRLSSAQDSPLQQIFYGAPGTGKSHEVKKLTGEWISEDEERDLPNVFRTTFHPDTDYASFVGCYKPTMKPTSKEEKTLTGKDEEIVYEFVPQVFTDAYVYAYNNPDQPTYLVIEEINRGNCAQIFGDLFQLLDRKDGKSEYKIKADKDLGKYLNEAKDNNGQDVLTNKEGIKDGKLCLPANLHILATMNTSDQSLFPIDSAFKRRWDWKYIPISNARKNYVIEVDGDQYDWWSFLETINSIIESATRSEDKKLGYFFAKAKGNIISVETFVSKVIFYLWNDVFKDSDCNHKAFNDNGELLAFHKFFNDDGSANTNVVIKFLQDLEVEPFENTDDDTTSQVETTPNDRRKKDNSRYIVNGKDNLKKSQMTREAFKLYLETHPEDDAQSIVNAWNGLGLENYVQHLVETEEEFTARTNSSVDSNKRAVQFELSNKEKIYLSTQFGIGNVGKFIEAVNNANWDIRIEKMPN
ncbi:MAG: AAA family ATPase [Bacteroidales bacterium]|nr:AAA family ATPase [Bacteroidales bacterium]